MGKNLHEGTFGCESIDTLFHMCESGHIYPKATWLTPLRFVCMDVKRFSIWRIMINPHDFRIYIYVCMYIYFNFFMVLTLSLRSPP